MIPSSLSRCPDSMSASSHAAAHRPPSFQIDPDIRTAQIPPSALYHEPAYFAHQQDTVFARSWHLVGDVRELIDDRLGEAVHAAAGLPRRAALPDPRRRADAPLPLERVRPPRQPSRGGGRALAGHLDSVLLPPSGGGHQLSPPAHQGATSSATLSTHQEAVGF